MELSPLRTFQAIAAERNLTRAAKRVHLTQPAVSAQLGKLEEELGTQLFHRTSKGMELTEAGRLFLDHVVAALAWIDDGVSALASLKGLERGSLSLGGGATATTYLMPTLISEFHHHYPEIQLFVREQGSARVAHAVASGTLDLGLITLPLEPDLKRRLLVQHYKQDELKLILPPEHRFSGQREVPWSALQDQPMVLFEAGTAVRHLIDSSLKRAHVSVRIVMELRSLTSIQQMVNNGIGAAFVSQFALKAGAGASLIGGPGPPRRELAWITRRDRELSPAAKTFLNLALTHCVDSAP